MGFVWCSINGQLYGKSAPSGLTTPHAIAHNSELLSLLEKSEGEQRQHAVDFLTHLAVCNTVVPATTATGQLIYQVSPIMGACSCWGGEGGLTEQVGFGGGGLLAQLKM